VSAELPRRLGPFLLLRHLASGGMGEVYLAHQSLGVAERLCVVKTVRPELAESADAMRRFLDEARTTALLSHRNVAAVLDVGEADGTAFIAVEHVAGRDLHAVFQRSRRQRTAIPEDVVLYVIAELLDALAYVHRATDPRSGTPLNIVHRDISPHNVMVSFEGEVKLIDFGVARSAKKTDVTHTGQAVGKIRYMAPEQARAEQTDGTADVFAACIVAVELLTGRRFYGDMSVETLWMRIAAAERHEPRGFSTLGPELQDMLAQGLSPTSKNRPSASALKEQLAAVQVARGTVGSSSTLREYLAVLFEGAQEQERRAGALLLQEPTSVNAAMLPSATVVEDTPAGASSGQVDFDAKTDSHIDLQKTVRGSPGPRKRDAPTPAFSPALPQGTSGVEGTPRTAGVVPATSTALKRRRQRRSSFAIAAGVALPVLLGLGVVLGVIAQPAPSDVEVPMAAIESSPTDVDPPPMPRIEAVAPVATVTIVVPPSEPAVEPVVVEPPAAEPARQKRVVAKKAAKRPKLLGDRVRALKECAPKPKCATSVLARARDVAELSPEEFKAFDDDVDWCLKQCR
jgi:serine/threonine-protein kinase